MDEHDSAPSRGKLIGGTVAVLVIISVIGIVVGQTVDREEIQELVERLRAYGDAWWAPVALIAAFVIINLTGIPGTPLTLAAGAVWGWLVGGAWVMAAVMIGTFAPYVVAKMGLPRVQHAVEKRFASICERVRDEGLTAVMILRLMHIFPFAAISYASGIAGVRPRDYAIGTFLGTFPGVFIYTYLADSILEGLISPRQATWRLLIAGVLVAALVVGTRIVSRRMANR